LTEPLTEDSALDLITSPLADIFTRALDMCGWKIVAQDPRSRPDGLPRWPIGWPRGTTPDDWTPAWADGSLDEVKPKATILRLIKSDKPARKTAREVVRARAVLTLDDAEGSLPNEGSINAEEVNEIGFGGFDHNFVVTKFHSIRRQTF
jgi:hypothetical protein